MVSKSENTQITSFLLDYCDNLLSNAELESFESLMELFPEIERKAKAGKQIRQALRKIPRKGVKPGFDQRMAARFSMELERETAQNNANRIGDRNLTAI